MMVGQCRKLSAMGVVLGVSFALSAGAEPKSDTARAAKVAPQARAVAAKADNSPSEGRGSAPQRGKAEARTDKAEGKTAAKADKAEGKTAAKADKAEAKTAAKADKAEGKTAAKADKAEGKAAARADKAASVDEKGDESASGNPHARHGKYKSAVVELRERYKAGKLAKPELEKELEALRESRAQRRREHQHAIHERWGKSLALPGATEELRRHERRMARLHRLSLVTETERKGAAKDKLAQRIEKLTVHENERHARKMSQLEASARGPQVPASATAGVEASAEKSPPQATLEPGEKP